MCCAAQDASAEAGYCPLVSSRRCTATRFVWQQCMRRCLAEGGCACSLSPARYAGGRQGGRSRWRPKGQPLPGEGPRRRAARGDACLCGRPCRRRRCQGRAAFCGYRHQVRTASPERRWRHHTILLTAVYGHRRPSALKLRLRAALPMLQGMWLRRPNPSYMRVHQSRSCFARSPFGSHVAEHLLDALAAAAAGGDDAMHGRVQKVTHPPDAGHNTARLTDAIRHHADVAAPLCRNAHARSLAPPRLRVPCHQLRRARSLQVLERVCDVLTGWNLYETMTDPRASHVARRLLSVAAGRDVSPPSSKKVKNPASPCAAPLCACQDPSPQRQSPV